MKASKILLFVLISSICMAGSAQTAEHTFHYDLNGVNVVVLNLDGVANILSSDDKQIHVVSSLNTSGDVWGIKVQKRRPEFITSSSLSSDTLYVETPSLFSYSSIGINTYKEHVGTTIQVSRDVKVVVSNANDINMISGFSAVDIISANLVRLINLEKTQIESIICNSSEALLFNGLTGSETYEFQGIGDEAYSINAKCIELTLK